MTKATTDSFSRSGLWVVVLVFLLAVLVPTLCVLYFMDQAVRNERLVVRQKLIDAYREPLQEAGGKVQQAWLRLFESLDSLPHDAPAPELFALASRSGVGADAHVILDARQEAVFPPPAAVAGAGDSTAFVEANNLEFELGRFAAAAAAYAAIAEHTADSHRAAQALQAQARCLVKANQPDGALKVLTADLMQPQYRAARDAAGRFIVPNAQLLAMQMLSDPGDQRYQAAAAIVINAIATYSQPNMPLSQRRFLAESLAQLEHRLDGEARVTLDNVQYMIRSELFAADYLASRPPRPERLRITRAADGIWHGCCGGGNIVAVFREATLLKALQAQLDASQPAGAKIVVLPPDMPAADEHLIEASLPSPLPYWRLAVVMHGPDPFVEAASRQIIAYRWTAVLVVAAILLLSLGVARYLNRQIRLTRLKNDLIATVSHELKTPLASMRVLVDTLREGRCRDREQAGEYFDLIARENERLTRLIDNFLTFSRMERNKRAFDFEPVDMGEVVACAAAAVGERFSTSQSRLDVEAPPALPRVLADRDAMITVVLNLLDNAWKYSGDDKAVKVRSFAADSAVFVEVTDNGVGMSRRAQRRIFEKFYQVDQTLARRAGGCGLGLSIVKFILDAHGGDISVRSQLRQGSTFTVRLPAADSRVHDEQG